MVEQTTTVPKMDENVNYGYGHNYSGLSFDQLYELFMKMDKDDLARLLAAKEIAKTNIPQIPCYPVYPQYPPQYPWITWYNTIC